MLETRYAKSGDLSIAYQVIGDGPRDLVYVPGIVSHVEFFHELPGYTEFLQGLARFARVIVFDKRGNGLSDRISGAPSVAERMEDITAVMDAVGSKRAVLFAVSEGGPISLLFAATYPDRVESIVLYETFVSYGGVPGHTLVWQPDAHREFTERWMPLYGTGASIAGFGASLAEDPHVQALWGQAERLSNSPGGFREVYEALRETDVHAALPSVQAPCLVIYGKNQPTIDFDAFTRYNPDYQQLVDALGSVPGGWFEAHGAYLAEHLPQARLVTLDGVDHFPWFAHNDRIVAEVEEFVTGARSVIASDRVLATLLFIDIVGSTARAAELGDRRWRELKQNYYSLVRRHLVRFRGIEVDAEGDGVFMRFDSPARAVSCACAIRDGVHGLGLEIRAGIHTGEIELVGDDVTGLAVHIGARVVALADANEVLVSRTVKDLVAGSGIAFIDRGTHVLKGVPDTWEVYAVAGGSH
ncbi:MAG: adenylate/guanylate cyclase domain-containing protein [Gammaproteobacteria bacterium]|nr:adenylate/guanylate cyclase domain-containing protein [Gammaproteobacteria bacterium]